MGAPRYEPLVRRATPQDHAELVRLATRALDHIGAHRGGAAFLDREARNRPVDTSVAADLDASATGATLVLLGCLGDVPVGYAVARSEPTASGMLTVVDELYVEPEARSVGVGSALMEALLDAARRHGSCGIQAEALPGDRATKNFFEGFGLVARKITVHRSLDEGTPAGA